MSSRHRRPEWIPAETLYVRALLPPPICHYRKFVSSWQVKDVSNEESHPESLRESPWHGGRLHWLETGCTSNFCNEIPQTPPTAIQNGGEGRGWREEVGRDGSREFSERLPRAQKSSKNLSLYRIICFGILSEKWNRYFSRCEPGRIRKVTFLREIYANRELMLRESRWIEESMNEFIQIESCTYK